MMQWLVLAAAVHVLLAWAMATRRGWRARHGRGRADAHDPESWPFASVIVPAWQEHGTIEGCLESLSTVSYPAWEIIIVAGGPDGTYRAALDASVGNGQIRVIEQPPRGKNAAINLGLSAARGDVLVVLDADSRVAPGWLRALVRPLLEGAAASTGNYHPLRRSPIALGGEMEKVAAYCIYGATTLQGSGSIALRRSTIETIGGFPEDVPVGVDWDLDARLAMRGLQRSFCPLAIVYTERPATLREWWQNEVRWRRAHLASLFRLRTFFMPDLRAVGASLYLYALAWFAVALTCGAIIAIATGSPDIRMSVLAVWVSFVAWVALRRASLAIEVAAFTGQSHWLRLGWVPSLLIFGTFVASCIASISMRRTTIFFKGPRSSTTL